MKKWFIGPFEKTGNIVLSPSKDYSFRCPIKNENVNWMSEGVYNPVVMKKDGVFHMIFRADSHYAEGVDGYGVAKTTCRLGHATSKNGFDFVCDESPVIYPDNDDFREFEWWGGCQDLHIVCDENGRYFMNYDAWTGKYDDAHAGFGNDPDGEWEDVLMTAYSDDLVHWTKCGVALKPKWKRYFNHSRSGVIISKLVDGNTVAQKIGGKYYMYMSHEGTLACSEDLIKWDLVLDGNGVPKQLFVNTYEKGFFDTYSHEAGAGAILCEQGIVYFYNAFGTVDGVGECWSQGQALISKDDLTTVIDKTEEPLLVPEYEWEKVGHAKNCLVCNSLCEVNGKLVMYYGGADTVIGCAIRK